MGQPKYREVAGRVRAQITDGVLRPGQSAPSGAALARVTGYSPLTCRKALRVLIRDGVLVAGASRNARPRVPSPGGLGDGDRADAARALSTALASYRKAADLTQPQLAERVGVSVTTVGHAETGRLWQSRRFWERADIATGAAGHLLALADAYRADCTRRVDESPPSGSPQVAVAALAALVSVSITWADGSVTTVYPPDGGDS